VPATPGPYGAAPHTPGTPNTPSEYAPHTPGAYPVPPMTVGGVADVDDPEAWHIKDVQVSITDGAFSGQKGFIVSADGDFVVVELEGGSEQTISKSSVQPVVAEKKAKVMVLRGEYKGQTGTLMSINGDDGIVKMADYVIVDMSHLAKCR
jgi:transcription elongation factor SPT5